MTDSMFITMSSTVMQIEEPPQNTSLLVYNAMRASLGLSHVQGATQQDFLTLAPKVTALRLSNMGLSSVPLEVLYLGNLKHLDVSGNHLSSLPAELLYLSKLEVLDASRNILTEFPALPAGTQKVYLEDNRIETVPDLSKAVLTVIDLESNRVRFSHDSRFPKTVTTLMLSENLIDVLP